ncbi:DUF916 domain-containing protein [Glycomyces luteolus]|uniref:DUF916 domain-containing protein n=1 Tax=Glycomyces luteolus TaxID=2670330 RepID=A0A9X3PCZ2_9ACTN|nr:DUF916 domain-containing protein [Glycomyces luteolus]MDA1361472.1 DUF916 domain-containing protein [Glycomyces luteolus]
MKPIPALCLQALSAAALAAALLAANSAAAQEAAAEEPAVVTWGVNPSSQDGPDGRSAFDYELDPGETLIDFVGVSNFGTEPLTVGLYALDAFTTETGTFDLLPSGEEPVDVGSWIGFNEPRLTIPPKSRLDVPFALTVPADATPGDHVGGIVAVVTESTTGASGSEIQVERRVGARIHLRVSGEIDPDLVPESDDEAFHYTWNPIEPGGLSFKYAVENTGNVRLQGTLVARVSGPWGLLKKEFQVAELPQILPGDRYEGTVRFEGVWPLLYEHLELIVRPEIVNEADAGIRLSSRSDETGFWAPPWTQAAVAALLVFAVWIWIKARKRERRNASRPDAGTPAKPAPETDESAPPSPDTPKEPAEA